MVAIRFYLLATSAVGPCPESRGFKWAVSMRARGVAREIYLS